MKTIYKTNTFNSNTMLLFLVKFQRAKFHREISDELHRDELHIDTSYDAETSALTIFG